MAITIKRSTDSGAPSVGNSAGTIIALFDFCLVSALGWTKTVLGTNQAKYTQPAGTNGFCIQVDDTSTSSARIIGWESLSALNNGVNPFPSTAQLSGGIYLDHNAAGPLPWRFFSDGKIFYLVIKWTGTTNCALAFGDYTSYKAGDIFNTVLIGSTSAVIGSAGSISLAEGSLIISTSQGTWGTRAATQIGTSVALGKHSDYHRGSARFGSAGCTYPEPISGGVVLAPVWVHEPLTTSIRGLLPGIWSVCHNRPFVDGDTFSVSSGVLAGRSFEVLFDNFTQQSQMVIETSNTWGGF